MNRIAGAGFAACLLAAFTVSAQEAPAEPLSLEEAVSLLGSDRFEERMLGEESLEERLDRLVREKDPSKLVEAGDFLKREALLTEDEQVRTSLENLLKRYASGSVLWMQTGESPAPEPCLFDGGVLAVEPGDSVIDEEARKFYDEAKRLGQELQAAREGENPDPGKATELAGRLRKLRPKLLENPLERRTFRLKRMDPHTGKTEWKTTVLPRPVHRVSAGGTSAIIAGHGRAGRGWLGVYDLETGEAKWKRGGETFPGPILFVETQDVSYDKTHILIGGVASGGGGWIFSFDMESGEPVYRKGKESFPGPVSHAYPDGEKVWIRSIDPEKQQTSEQTIGTHDDAAYNWVRRLDAEGNTVQFLSHEDLEGVAWNVSFRKGKAYLSGRGRMSDNANKKGWLECRDGNTGNILWKKKTGFAEPVRWVQFTGESVIVGACDYRKKAWSVRSLNAESGKTDWTIRTVGRMWGGTLNALLVRGNQVWVGLGGPGVIACLDARTGETLWERKAGGAPVGLRLWKRHLILHTEGLYPGLTGLDAETGEVRWETDPFLFPGPIRGLHLSGSRALLSGAGPSGEGWMGAVRLQGVFDEQGETQ